MCGGASFVQAIAHRLRVLHVFVFVRVMGWRIRACPCRYVDAWWAWAWGWLAGSQVE
jgi:hypothetical protein